MTDAPNDSIQVDTPGPDGSRTIYREHDHDLCRSDHTHWTENHCYGCGRTFFEVHSQPTRDCICDPRGVEYMDWTLAWVLTAGRYSKHRPEGQFCEVRYPSLKQVQALDDVLTDWVLSRPHPHPGDPPIPTVPYNETKAFIVNAFRLHLSQQIERLKKTDPDYLARQRESNEALERLLAEEEEIERRTRSTPFLVPEEVTHIEDADPAPFVPPVGTDDPMDPRFR